MTARNVVLSVDTLTIPKVGSLLAQQGIRLGPVLAQEGKLRCFAIQGKPQPVPVGGLSERDRAILVAFADGVAYSEIGELVGMAEGYVKTYCTRYLFRRLGAKDRASAVAIAYRMGVFNDWEAAA